MKHIIFFLHGVGKHNDDWHKEALAALTSTRKNLGRPDSFDDDYEIVPLRYDDIFSRYWDAYNTRAEGLSKISISGNTNDLYQRIHSVASQGVEDDSLIHWWGDTFLYLLTEYGALVRQKIWAQIIQKLVNTVAQENYLPRYSIIAHSLGTRVIHDTLQAAFTGDVGSAYRNFGKPRVLAMVANVLRSTSFNEGHLNAGLVVYPSRDTDTGACWRYLNIWHPLDPIARFRQFHPERYPTMATAIGLYDIETQATDVVELEEIHSLNRYLEIPEVCASIIDGLEEPLSTGRVVSDNKIKEARRIYRPTRKGGDWKARAEQIANLDLTSVDSWAKILEVLS